MSEETPRERFCAIVVAAVEKHASVEDQKKHVMRLLGRDAELRQQLIEDFVETAVRDAVYNRRHSTVTALKASRCSRGIDAVAATAGTAAASLLDWKLADGRILGDMLGRELDPMIEESRRLARGHAVNSSFFQLLREKTPDDKPVRSKVSPALAGVLWKSAGGHSSRANPDNGAADADDRVRVDNQMVDVPASAVA